MRQSRLIYLTRRHEDRDKSDVIVDTFSIHSISYFVLLYNGSTHAYVASVVFGGLELPAKLLGMELLFRVLWEIK